MNIILLSRMKLVVLLFAIWFAGVQGCSTAKNTECFAAAVGCGATCLCDFPACECCIPCLACVTAAAAGCCECLFPDWSACKDDKIMGIIHKNLTKQATDQVCFHEGKTYSCGDIIFIWGVGPMKCSCNGVGAPYWTGANLPPIRH